MNFEQPEHGNQNLKNNQIIFFGSFFWQVDVFSFGIVMWEILTGEEPYADLHCGGIIGELFLAAESMIQFCFLNYLNELFST